MKNKVRNPVVHFEVLGRDASVLRKFYSEAFGWQLGPADDSPLEYSMVHQKEQGSGIDGGIGKAPQGPGHVTFYVGVDDAQAALDKVEASVARPFSHRFRCQAASRSLSSPILKATWWGSSRSASRSLGGESRDSPR